MQNTIILIDGGYFDHLNRYLRRNKKKQINIENFSLNIVEQASLMATNQKDPHFIMHRRTKFYHAAPYQSKDPIPEEKERYSKNLEFFDSINRVRNHEFVPVGRVRPDHRHCPYCEKEFTVNKQKGVDVAIALDLVKMAQKKVVDVFILVSGDEDLSDAVAMAKESLSQVYVFYTYDSSNRLFASIKLRNTADDRYNMNIEFLEKCGMKTK